MMENSLATNSSDQKQKTKSIPSQCRVCGVPALYSYFGVIVCQSCKVFFRRNAQESQTILKCRYDDHCEVNMYNRHVCTYCRLVKCLRSGMQTNMIRASRPNNNKRREKRNDPVTSIKSEHFSTLNLLQSDQSTLSINQWNLISNLSHCYDESGGLSLGESYIRQKNSLPPKSRFKGTSLIKFYQISLEGVELLYKNNQDFLSLSTIDRSILLHQTFKYTGCLASNFIFYKVGLTNCPTYYSAVEVITHPRVISATKCLTNRLDFDMIIMKFFLAILTFSTINCTTDSNTSSMHLFNVKEILHIQDKYIDLTWRYLIYKYNFQEAVRYFSELIKCIFAVNEILVETQEYPWVSETFDSTIQQIKQTLNLND